MWIHADIQYRYDTTVLEKNLTKDDTNRVQKNVGMTQQSQNKNLTKDDTNKLQKNVGRTKQCQNKNFTKDDTNKFQKKCRYETTVLE